MDRRGLAFWLLNHLAPDDAGAALHDLRADREEQLAQGRAPAVARLAYWGQVTGICLYAIRDRALNRIRRGSRRSWDGAVLRSFLFALRGLRRSPGMVLTATLTLGVGIGATLSLLAVIQGLFRDLPVPYAHEIVRLTVVDSRGRAVPVPIPVVEEWTRTPAVLQAVGLFVTSEATFLGPGGAAFRPSAAAVSAGVLEALGMPPHLGRFPVAGLGDPPVAALGFDLWQREFGGDPGVLGSIVTSEGTAFTVVGVLPEGFAFPYHEEIWTSLDLRGAETIPGAEVIGRLAGGSSVRAVGERLSRTLRLAQGTGTASEPARVRVERFASGGGESGEMVALGGLTALVLLLLAVAAANISGILLVRAAERSRVLAVHAALGAGRVQVALLVFSEALWLALAGGVLGLALAVAMVTWVESALSVHWGYYWIRVAIEPSTLAYTMGMVLTISLVSGTAPAAQAMQSDLNSLLRSGGGATSGAGRSKARSWFVGTQVALSTAGLVAAVTLTLGLLRSSGIQGALPLDEVAVAEVEVDALLFPTPEERRTILDRLIEETRGLEGVDVLSASTAIPGFGAAVAALHREGQAVVEGERPRVAWTAIDSRHFTVYEMPTIAGRALRDDDSADAPSVVVVSRSFVRRWLEGGGALGARIRLEGVHAPESWAEVVGVVEDPATDVRGSGRVYLPLGQVDAQRIFLSARASAGFHEGALPDFRAAAMQASPRLIVESTMTLRALIEYLGRMPRVLGALGALGGLASALVAGIGLYGVIAFIVRVRLPELGVRLALGAGASDILRLVLKLGFRTVLPGLGAGLLLGALLSPLLVAFLFGVSLAVPGVYGAVTLAVLTMAAAASLGPALRAARLDPAEVLRAE